jgi:hypothetical protein
MAEQLGMNESNFTRHERGESRMTLDFVRNVAKILEIDALTLITIPPSGIINNRGPIAGVGNATTTENLQSSDAQQVQLLTRLAESVIALNERITSILASKQKDNRHWRSRRMS